MPLPDSAHTIAGWAKYVVDVGIVYLFLYKLPELKDIYETRMPYDEEWLLQCRVTIRKFRFFMAAWAFLLTFAVMFASLITQIHSGEKSGMFILMATPVALAVAGAVAVFCAFFSHQAATFWMMNAQVKSAACVIVFFAVINVWLLR